MTHSDWICGILGHFPDPDVTFPDKLRLSIEEVKIFASFWISEGVPFVFQACPGAYVLARENLAAKLEEEARHIGITGSARLGYSLKPEKFGHPYQLNGSDIDMFLISNNWFTKLLKEIKEFKSHFSNGDIVPKTEIDNRNWISNCNMIPNFEKFGFIDDNKIPVGPRYPTVSRIRAYTSQFRDQINKLTNKTLITKISTRVYKNWSSAHLRIAYNIRDAVHSR